MMNAKVMHIEGTMTHLLKILQINYCDLYSNRKYTHSLPVETSIHHTVCGSQNMRSNK